MIRTAVSRRFHHGCAACALGAADAFGEVRSVIPPNYTSPTKVPDPGQAPGMQAQVISGKDGAPRTWAIIFAKGDEIMSGLSDWMKREHVSGAHLSAIGAFSSAMFGWFDKDQRAYLNIPVDEQVECISLLGDIGLVEQKPALHIHGCVGHRDGSVKGGHLLRAVAFPTLEVFVTESQIPLHKQQDPETTLELFNLNS
jgi:uncharacterized protein